MMKTKKRVAGVLLAAVVCVNLVGCGEVNILEMDLSTLKDVRSLKELSDWYYDQMGDIVVGEPVLVESISYDRYAYQQLDEITRQVYDQILDAILKYQDKVTLVSTDQSVLDMAYNAVMADYGGLFWVSGYQYNTYKSGEKVIGLEFAPKYTMTKEQKDTYQKTVDETVDAWLDGVSITDSDYDKAKYVFETLVDKVDYVNGAENNQNILSVFLNQQTVCQGYADAAWYMLNKLGIRSTIITGIANEQAHAWNLVYLDKAYYFMDVTWGNSKYLEADNSEVKRINYAYMAMTSEELCQTHIIDMPFEIPECLSTQDNYFLMEKLYFDTFDIGSIGRTLEKSWDAQESEISLKFSTIELFNQFITYFIDDKHISDFCWEINTISYILDDSACVVTLQWR